MPGEHSVMGRAALCCRKGVGWGRPRDQHEWWPCDRKKHGLFKEVAERRLGWLEGKNSSESGGEVTEGGRQEPDQAFMTQLTLHRLQKVLLPIFISLANMFSFLWTVVRTRNKRIKIGRHIGQPDPEQPQCSRHRDGLAFSDAAYLCK